jgi:hypothetical protein
METKKSVVKSVETLDRKVELDQVNRCVETNEIPMRLTSLASRRRC